MSFFSNLRPSSKRKRFLDSQLRIAIKGREALNPMARGIFDRVYVAPEAIVTKNPLHSSSRVRQFASAGAVIETPEVSETISRVRRVDRLEALQNALAKTSSILKVKAFRDSTDKKRPRAKGAVATDRAALPISRQPGEAKAFTGRFSPARGRNILRISGGLQ